jgi:hypothetical protein
MNKLNQYVLIAFILINIGWLEVQAATITASSCSNSDIQTAINSASSGDTVSVPAGNCTWTGIVSIPSSKGITVQGAGIGNTNITISGSQGFTFSIGTQALYRLSGFTIQATGSGTPPTVRSCGGFPITINDAIQMRSTTQFLSNFRIDNIRIYANPENHNHNGAICVNGLIFGIIDNVSIEGIGRGWFLSAGYNADNSGGDYAWSVPLSPGGPYNIYIEDSSYSCSPANDCQVYDGRAGGRTVFRYNTVKNGWIEPHAPQSYGDDACRGSMYNEIYKNRFSTSAGGAWMAARLRSGTGIIWANEVTNPNSGGTQFYLESRRACEGDRLYDCRTSSSCTDGIGKGTNQSLTPLYGWENTLNGAASNVAIYGRCDHMSEVIQLGTHYYQSAKSGWNAYNYPHPLRGTGGIPAPPPPPTEDNIVSPQNLRIVK